MSLMPPPGSARPRSAPRTVAPITTSVEPLPVWIGSSATSPSSLAPSSSPVGSLTAPVSQRLVRPAETACHRLEREVAGALERPLLGHRLVVVALVLFAGDGVLLFGVGQVLVEAVHPRDAGAEQQPRRRRVAQGERGGAVDRPHLVVSLGSSPTSAECVPMRGWSWSMYWKERSSAQLPTGGRLNAWVSMGQKAAPQLARAPAAPSAAAETSSAATKRRSVHGSTSGPDPRGRSIRELFEVAGARPAIPEGAARARAPRSAARGRG